MIRTVPWAPLLAVSLVLPSALLAQTSRPDRERDTGSSPSPGDGRQSVSVQIAGGKVSLRYWPMAMRDRPLERQQTKGLVWSMSAKEAAYLETEVALVSGKVLIPPGVHRLSTWHKKRGVWHLLIFRKGPNYKSGSPYLETKLRVRSLAEAATTLRLALRKRGGNVKFSLSAGKTQLSQSFLALPVTVHKGRVAGKPVEFEFFDWPADPRIQNRVRNFERFQIGRMRFEGRFGAVYEIHCKSDGKGIFVFCESQSLSENRELLAATHKALQANPDDEQLLADVSALKQAVADQAGRQQKVMIAGTVQQVRQRSNKLTVTPKSEADTTTFELLFGIRRAEFTLRDKAIQKLDWR